MTSATGQTVLIITTYGLVTVATAQAAWEWSALALGSATLVLLPALVAPARRRLLPLAAALVVTGTAAAAPLLARLL